MVMLGVLVRQQLAVEVSGDSFSEFHRRSTETLALMVLIPASWDSVFCAKRSRESFGSPRLGWYGFLVTGVALLRFDGLRSGLGLELPGLLITRREAFVAAVRIPRISISSVPGHTEEQTARDFCLSLRRTVIGFAQVVQGGHQDTRLIRSWSSSN